ncbi:MAG: UMP kinase [Phycisphaeraceae bacterium]|nr:MAG: UMP kinase [Phycisphaeraceae bacterium]
MPTQRKKFSRVLLKLSGEAFSGEGGFGVDSDELRLIAREIVEAHRAGAQMAVVVGGGNIIRGAQLARDGLVHRSTADYMGMLGTVINGLALREAITELGQAARCMTAIDIPAVAEPFIRLRAIRHMERGEIVVLAGGIGNPFFTTDTTAALRATELECDAILKATKVDGVYTADPKKHPDATRFDTLTIREALDQKLGVMDMTALTMCSEQGLPIVVFDFHRPGNIARAVAGQPVGTIVSP